MITEVRYAFYSDEAAKKFGTVVWKNTNGEMITATAICDDPKGETYKWKDKVYVGEVVQFISSSIF